MGKLCSIGILLSIVIVLSAQKYSEFSASPSDLSKAGKLALYHEKDKLQGLSRNKTAFIDSIFETKRHLNVGDAYFKKRDYRNAISYYLKSLKNGRDHSSMEPLEQLYEKLSLSYAELNDYHNAYLYSLKQIGIRDSLKIRKQKRNLFESEEKYEIDQKETENELLRIEKIRNEAIIKYQRTIGILIAIALISLIILLLYLYKSNHKIKLLANDLRSAIKELESMNVNKDKLFSLISHDLIGPMGTCKSLIELLEYQDISKKDPEKIRLIISSIGKEVKKTYSLLENLLNWSRLQFGKIKYFPEDLNLHARVKENVVLYQKLAKDKYITIKNSVPDSCFVFADKNLLDIIIRNLLSNAIKFTEQGKLIKVTSEKENSFIRICIEDQGIGMNKTTLENIFKDDTYHSERGTEGERGSGLGLIMVKEFVKYHKGNLEIKSEPGKGSRFIFRLPAGQEK